jgi:tetratricopeptide (TPR) repeat protein
MKLMFKYITIGLFLICLITDSIKSQNYADSGYYYQKIGFKEKAAGFFEQFLYENPDNYPVRLDLAYLYQSLNMTGQARNQFEYVSTHSSSENEIKMAKDAIAAIDKVPNNQTTNYGVNSPYADSGYYYLKQGNKKKAAECFEKYLTENPKDIKIHLQLAYIYYDIKNYSKSKYHFDYVAKNSRDQEEVEKARSAAFVIKEDMSFNAKRSLDVYFYNFYDTYQENYIANLVSHVNFKLAKNTFGGLYLDLYTDTKSTKAVVYNDRFIEIGGFLRYNFLRNLFLEFRLGYAHQIDQDTSRINIKPLLVYFNRFGDAKVYVSSGKTSKTSLYMDMYYAAMYDYKYKNAFLQLAFQQVLRFHTGGYSYLESYLVETAQFDSRRLNYNNYAELGTGVRFHPNISTFPVLFVEPTYKAYFYNDPTGTQKNSFQVKAGFYFIFRTKL